MGKGDKRNRKQSIGLDLAPVPRKKARGYARMQDIQAAAAEADEKSHEERLAVRARHVGVNPDKKGLAQMKHVMLSEPAGHAIWLASSERDANALWDVYERLTAAEARYASVVLGTNLHAKVAKVEILPEALETRGEPPDDRTEDEKHRAAVNSWMHWKGKLGCLSTQRHKAIMDVSRGRKDPVVQGQLTQAGRNFVESLKALKEIVDRK